MKSVIILCLLALSAQSFAGSCLKQIQHETLIEVAKSLNVSPSSLKIRHIGGESMDGDVDNEGRDVDPSQEFFDIHRKDLTPNRTNALGMYLVWMEEISVEGEVVECQMLEMNPVPRSDWGRVYKTYL